MTEKTYEVVAVSENGCGCCRNNYTLIEGLSLEDAKILETKLYSAKEDLGMMLAIVADVKQVFGVDLSSWFEDEEDERWGNVGGFSDYVVSDGSHPVSEDHVIGMMSDWAI